MKSVLVATSLMAAMAMSKPLEKRYYVTETDVYTVTVTQTGGWAAGPTKAWGHWGWGQSADPAATASANPTNAWGNWGHSADPAAATSTTAPVDPATPTSAAAPAWTPSSSWTPQAPANAPESPASPAGTPTSAPVAPAWTSAPATASSSSPSAPNSYAQAIIDQHNNHRQNHSAQALVWDNNMANIAQQIAESCVYAHNTQAGGGGYGQNIGAGAPPDGVPALITNEMYNNEIGFFPLPYGQAQPDMSNFESWGHFSQIVWQSTTRIGCATVNCPNGLANTGSGVSPWFTVCNYSPAGNFQGQYGANIAQPKGESVVVVPS